MPASSAEKGDTQPVLPEVLKHPLIVLLLGSLIGSVIVPYVSGRSARAGQIEELKMSSALAAVKNNNDVDRRLNILITTFGSFWKDTQETTREDRKAELRTKIYGLYEEFDQTAWWWFDEARQQAKLLGLLSEEEASETEAISAQYNNSLGKSVAALDSVWQISLRQSPSPSGKEAANVLARARESLAKDRVDRYHLMEKFTNLLRRGAHRGRTESS